jgi:hypothetical protein
MRTSPTLSKYYFFCFSAARRDYLMQARSATTSEHDYCSAAPLKNKPGQLRILVMLESGCGGPASSKKPGKCPFTPNTGEVKIVLMKPEPSPRGRLQITPHDFQISIITCWAITFACLASISSKLNRGYGSKA